MNKHQKGESSDALYEAVLQLQTIEECRNFFSDLCTPLEMRAMEQRYQVALLLTQGYNYNDIQKATKGSADAGASSATISRVNRSLQYGTDGYAVVFERLGITPKEKE